MVDCPSSPGSVTAGSDGVEEEEAAGAELELEQPEEQLRWESEDREMGQRHLSAVRLAAPATRICESQTGSWMCKACLKPGIDAMGAVGCSRCDGWVCL